MTVQDRLAPGKYRLRVEDYARLERAGTFGSARTELIEGDVIVMSPQYRPHGTVKLGLYDALREALRGIGSILSPVVEFSLDLAEDSMPEPDLMLTSEPRGEGAVPLSSVALVVEVADTTLADDLGLKLRLYARAGIPEYWVADLKSRILHQMWGPVGEGYSEVRQFAFGDVVTSATIEHLTIETENL